MTDRDSRLNLGHCPDCGKTRYATRRRARRAAKVFHPGNAMRAYQCGDFWHIGHLNPKT